ncbi:flagellar protein export ATPase FliI [Caldinitratiruptor microaerophilus]|nr:flagellar protein export ATPase FliI [Caldinitratiruptor microaerophilus]
MREALRRVAEADPLPLVGRVDGVTGLVIQSRGPRASVGELCRISPPGAPGQGLWAEVVGFRDRHTLLMPLGEAGGIAPGWEVRPAGRPLTVPVGPALLGRVLDGLGRPLDGRGPVEAETEYPLAAAPPGPLQRRRITEPLPVGVRAIDGLLTVGRGQRIGIFAGSGVGKSTLLAMMARGTAADVNVIALVGERGREVREFLEADLGPEGLARSVVVVATSDRPALVRLKGAFLATAIAEYFRDRGLDVLLLMDSVTRLAMAQREIGLAAGEPPTSRGYTPSVFSLLPRLLERAGTGPRGSITGFYTVLVDGDDMTEPIADAVRGILDGHIVLSRRLASLNHYPAIDVLASVSRVMPRVATPEHQEAAARFRSALATYREAEDLIQIGAYQPGSSERVDRAIALLPRMEAYLQQRADERSGFDEAVGALRALFEDAGAPAGA